MASSPQDIIYVTGHRHPDTDSIASAIAYAFFKRTMGQKAVPCRLGPVNAETSYLLKRFHFPVPMLLSDARVTLSEINLDPLTYIHPETTIFESLRIMQQEKHTYCGVVDEQMHLVGLVTKSDIASIGLEDTANAIDTLAQTSVENIRESIDGEILYDDPDVHMNGRVSIVAMTERENLAKYDIRDRIVIIGDDPEAQKCIIEKGAGLLIIVWAEKAREDVLHAAEQHHCPIIRSGHGATNTSRYIYFAPPVSTIMNTDLVTFSENELAEDVGAKMLRSRYHIYPVVDDQNRLKGYAARYHIMNCENKKIIMVDHNEFSQSVRAIEKARVLEVIDHHRINDFSSSQPVAFRNEIVGSTATIVAKIFRENQIPIPADLAGLLLGALLSDTMDFHSPTTTPLDIQTANILAAMADLDLEEFAGDLFAVAADTKGKTYAEMINQDIKFYDIEGIKISISQVIVNDAAAVIRDSAEIQTALDSFAKRKQTDLSLVCFTSIMEDGSVVYCGGDRAPWGQEAFQNEEDGRHRLCTGLLSRKQQILPKITEVIGKYV